MALLGSALGVLGGLAGGIIGGINANKAAKRKEALLNSIENRYKAEYNTNQLDRTENKAALAEAAQRTQEQNAIDAARAKVTGATPAAQAAMRQASAQGYGNLVNSVAARASAAKDNYMQGLNSVAMQKAQTEDNKVQQAGQMTTNAFGVVAPAFANLGQSIWDMRNKIPDSLKRRVAYKPPMI